MSSSTAGTNWAHGFSGSINEFILKRIEEIGKLRSLFGNSFSQSFFVFGEGKCRKTVCCVISDECMENELFLSPLFAKETEEHKKLTALKICSLSCGDHSRFFTLSFLTKFNYVGITITSHLPISNYFLMSWMKLDIIL